MATSVRGRLRVLDKVESANGRLENLEYRPRYLVLGPAACTSLPAVSWKTVFSTCRSTLGFCHMRSCPAVDSSHEGILERLRTSQYCERAINKCQAVLTDALVTQ